MKKCQHCGYENENGTNFCISCGSNIKDIEPTEPQTDINQNDEIIRPNNNKTYDSQDYQQTDYQQQYNNQQTTYQTPTAPVYGNKNAIIAVILDLIGGIILYFLCGIGQLYLGLYKRGIVLCIAGFIPVIINLVLSLSVSELVGALISLIVGVILVIYAAYDAYLCTNAINEGKPIPLLFGSLDIQ